jgi:hypothetical protein
MSGPGFGVGGGGGGGQYPGEPTGYVDQRTSVMAILALVFALICFIPGFAVLGALFGVASLVAISRSGDRLTGRGLAVAGLILSLIVLAVQIGMFLGAGKLWTVFKREMVEPASQAMVDIDQGNFTTARKILGPEASKRISDDDFKAFRDQYQAELGSFTGMPTTFWGIFEGYSVLSQQMQQVSGRNDTLPPLPADFDKGKALAVFQFDPVTAQSGGSGGGTPFFPQIVNITIIAPSGSKWTLYDPQRGTGSGGGSGAGTPKPEKQDSKPADTPEASPTEKPSTSPPEKPDSPAPETPKEPDKPGPG